MEQGFGKRYTPRSSQPSMFEIINWHKTGAIVSESRHQFKKIDQAPPEKPKITQAPLSKEEFLDSIKKQS